LVLEFSFCDYRTEKDPLLEAKEISKTFKPEICVSLKLAQNIDIRVRGSFFVDNGKIILQINWLCFRSLLF